ncbi:MAG: LuxR C-terminal-related transcriptional regulator, partial [Gemmatimonadota bacterium]|nr:LuxR C-terminal-related transcriptional regulator [Gemmatimonadota bacterium]
ISRHTVKTHLGALFHKLGVSTRAEAVAAGARAGVILL